MKNHICRHHFPVAVSLLFTALIGFGAIPTEGTRNSQSGSNPLQIAGPGQPIDTIGQNRIAADIGGTIKTFLAAVVDSNNTKWFITEKGVVSFNGEKWTLHNKNKKVTTQDLKGFAYEINPNGHELWMASPKGTTVASLPIDSRTGATTYHTGNTTILSNNVLQVAIGKSPMRWFGTDKGISAFRNNKWLSPDYEELYPGDLFQEFRITAMATDAGGDSLYVGTEGAGIARVFRNDVDAISGASVYAQWGPILLPSDKIYSIFIASDGTQWFGTDKGVARHTGSNTLKNWTVFNKSNGIADNFVQAITADHTGNIWIGTRSGASLFDGSTWVSFVMDDVPGRNNIRCIAADKTGVIWFGTEDGVMSYENGKFTSYR